MQIRVLISFILLVAFSSFQPKSLKKIDPCTVAGIVFIETSKQRADYMIYREESEAFADLVVYKEDNKLFADEPGHWYFTDKRDLADFYIYISDDNSNVDFSIFYTEESAYAGCK